MAAHRLPSTLSVVTMLCVVWSIQELFLQAVSELSYREAKREKRKTVQYEDVGT